MNPCAIEFVPAGYMLGKKLNPYAVEFQPKLPEGKKSRKITKNTAQSIDCRKFYTTHRALTVIYNAILNGSEYDHLRKVTMVPFSDGSRRVYVGAGGDTEATRSKKINGQVYWVTSFMVGMSKHHTDYGEYEIEYRSVIQYRVKQLGGYITKRRPIKITNEFKHIREVMDDIRLHVVTPTSYMKQRKAIYVKNLIRVQSIYRGAVVRRKNNKRIANMRAFRCAVNAIGIIRWWSIVKKTGPLIPECAICLADACPEGERQVTTTNCGHVFCTNCIVKHVGETQGNRGCPMCRAPLGQIGLAASVVTETVNDESTLRHIHTFRGYFNVRYTNPDRPGRHVTIRFINHRRVPLEILYITRGGEESNATWNVEENGLSGGIITYHNTRWRVISRGYQGNVWVEEFVINMEHGMNQRIHVDDHMMGDYP